MNNTEAYAIGYKIGTVVGIIGLVAFVIWAVWALYKYKPFSIAVKVLYDIRTLLVEIIKMYGNGPSMFSIKRFHNGLITVWSLVTASLFIRHNKMTAVELMAIIVPFLGVAGYNIFQSQQDKKMDIADKAVDSATDLGNKLVDNAADLDNKIEDKK